MNQLKLKQLADSLGVDLRATTVTKSDSVDTNNQGEGVLSKLDPEKKPLTSSPSHSKGSGSVVNTSTSTPHPASNLFQGKYYRYWTKTLIEVDMNTGVGVVKWSQVIPAVDSDFKREWKPKGKAKKPKKIILDEAKDTKEEVM